jgi:hypothetical protein
LAARIHARYMYQLRPDSSCNRVVLTPAEIAFSYEGGDEQKVVVTDGEEEVGASAEMRTPTTSPLLGYLRSTKTSLLNNISPRAVDAIGGGPVYFWNRSLAFNEEVADADDDDEEDVQIGNFHSIQP